MCPACERDLPWNRTACSTCAAPLPEGVTNGQCGHCLQHPPDWRHATSPLRYAWPLDRLIQRFKFHADLATGRVLGGLLAEFLAAQSGPRPDCIVPVPLHPARLTARGFNQASELARPVCRRLHVPLRSDLCQRTHATEVQSRLDAASRKRNLRNAFAVTAPVAGLSVAILDDVVTTGATVTALSDALQAAGATQIRVWSLARAAP